MYEWRSELIAEEGEGGKLQGPTGPQGPEGPQGAQGPAGPEGSTGPQGPAGVQGPQGIEGQPGTGIIVKGSVPNPGLLPDSGNATGDAYVVTTTGDLYVWDGGDWINMGPLQGPEGPAGVQGIQGVQGPAGGTGPTGPEGPTGSQGPIGAEGPQGPKGDPSTVPGPEGPQGDPGPPGANGLQGADSTVPGPPGPTGPAGSTGSQGPQGTTGTQGPKGDPGTAGAQGPAGPGVPAGGTVGQRLLKTGAGDFASGWADDTGGWTVIRKSADESVNSNTVQDDDHLKLQTIAGTCYEVELVAIYACPAGAGTPDIKAELSEDATARGTIIWVGLSATDAAQSLTTTDIGGAVATFGTAAAKRMVRGVGHHVGNGGILKFRWAQNTTTAGSPTLVYAGSVLRYRVLA